ncbi:MAG: PD40 domain-containing protein [Crocinitomicaceae bacterium]|nr:PD40 domain-containing protein [Crocinitomicaceae bacterium]
MKKVYLLFTALFFSAATFSQLSKEELNDLVENGSRAKLVENHSLLTFSGFHHQANKVADRLIELDSENANFNYRKGFSLMNSSKDFRKSIPYLEKAVQKINKNYDIASSRETAAPVEAHFNLGVAYHLAVRLDEAIEQYEIFLEITKKKNEFRGEAKLRIQQCLVAKELLKENKFNFEIENIGKTINTAAPEYAPIVSLDGAALYFASRRLRADSSNLDILEPGTALYPEDVYVSYLDFDGEFLPPSIMEFSKADRNEAPTAVSIDERLFYVFKDHTGNGDIYHTNFQGSKFRELEWFDTPGVNTDFWEPHITVTQDGSEKYFVSDRPGGYGGRDIYKIVKQKDGTWSEPINLGPSINTEYDEDSPFIAVDNKTLYFSSNGPKSMGGFDVFMAKRSNTGEWGEPINLGAPLNSTGDDIYYTTTADGFTGYFSSFRPGGFGNIDIYRIKNTSLGIKNLAAIKGEIETIDDLDIPEDVAFTIRCLDCDEHFEIRIFPRLSDKTYYANLMPCHKYEMIFHHNDGKDEFYRDEFQTECTEEYSEVLRRKLMDTEKVLIITPKEEKEMEPSFVSLKFKHLFAYNSNKVDPEHGALKEFLSEVLAQIERGRENVELTVSSSASKVPTRSFKSNESLAQSRADKMEKLLNDYFANRGITNVKIKIEDVKVDGPEFVRGERDNLDKYAPFQFVSIFSNALNIVESKEDTKVIRSKDTELKGQISPEAKRTGEIIERGNVLESEFRYHVITGVFNRSDFANGLVESMRAKGYANAKILGKKNNKIYVTAASFNDLNEAREMLQKAQNEIINTAWIFDSKE